MYDPKRFCFVLLSNLDDFLLYNIFCPHQISSTEFDPLFSVHRHALFICNFTSPCFAFVCLFLYLISSYCFFNTTQKVINGVGWLDERHGPSPILCDTVTLVFTLFIYFTILFSFTLIFTDNWFLVVLWLSVFLFNNWAIWKDNRLEQQVTSFPPWKSAGYGHA